MKDFIDLHGASGARYRFRLWPKDAQHVPIAGNYAYVRKERSGFSVVQLGECEDLSRARAEWAEAAGRGATHVFTRLNVPRAVRAAEHDDIAAHYHPEDTAAATAG